MALTSASMSKFEAAQVGWLMRSSPLTAQMTLGLLGPQFLHHQSLSSRRADQPKCHPSTGSLWMLLAVPNNLSLKLSLSRARELYIYYVCFVIMAHNLEREREESKRQKQQWRISATLLLYICYSCLSPSPSPSLSLSLFILKSLSSIFIWT